MYSAPRAWRSDLDPADTPTIVTGGASGLGRAIVARLADAGARVAVLDRDGDGLARLSDEVDVALTRTVELTDSTATDAAVAEVFDALGPVRILINNAGIIRNAPLVDVMRRATLEERLKTWHEVIAVNLTSVFAVSTSVADRMVAQRATGVIVNIGSISAAGNPGQSAYSAAKAGVHALTATWARELGPLGVRVNAIAPGFADTPSTHAALSETRIADLNSRVPMRRLADADEIALAVEQVIRNDYMNGAVIPVDGGLVL
jgi:3-oxoacyl-[acyl-carrier protein] reductase